jgi:hypothetical protein
MVEKLYTYGIFFFVVEIYDLLFSLFNKFPVSYVLDIEDHVSTLKTDVKG